MKKPTLHELDTDQHELIENAQARIRQKKWLYYHFIVFLLGSIFMIVLNKVLEYGVQYNWFIWGIAAWGFIFLLHFINVFVTNKFMGKDWERQQREKLVAKQKNKIAKLQQEAEKEFPLDTNPENTL
ncbi:2TM domain-containing protein [Galbibacter mesophilus]|uniref:2TM domain-containing protein n=1 Tax=Galbibacter mesophilus TaxID=379069 RepID=UPI00191FCBED|nr:2TM domain-containing protein [Galbibacter mesophilus]MCM5664330.1 2TM domain-containing protein [Galbibacter mesophilus]